MISFVNYCSQIFNTLTKQWRLRSPIIILLLHKVPPHMIHWERQHITSAIFLRKMYNLSYEDVSEKPKLRDIPSTKWPDSSKLWRLWATKELYQFGRDCRCETKCNKETTRYWTKKEPIWDSCWDLNNAPRLINIIMSILVSWVWSLCCVKS